MKKKISLYLYIVAAFAILLIPFAGMSFWATNETAEKKELSTFPKIMKDQQVNVAFFSEMGTYFEEHFAFRENLVTANNRLRSPLLGSDVNSRVIVGENDWLYFNGSLNDYLGKNSLTNRQLFMIARNIKLMQDYAESQGSQFLFVSPPNKNSVYSENMPDRYLQAETSNYLRLRDFLNQEGVKYLDLTETFKNSPETLYFARDTHWNVTGALAGYQEIMKSLQLPYESYVNVPFQTANTHVGDIDEMRYPKDPQPEEWRSYPYEYQVLSDFTDNMDNWIETYRGDKNNRLLMYRDSFGEQLLPFLANEFQSSFYTRYVPYDLNQVTRLQPTHVIVERAERTLPQLLVEIPVVPATYSEIRTGPQITTDTTLTVEKNQAFDSYFFSGTISDEYLEEQTKIYLVLRDANGNQACFETFYVETETAGDSGYQLYLPNSYLTTSDFHINVITVTDEKSAIIQAQDFNINEISVAD
ncbi:hypothetical protein M2139_002280 [Enterococcus sp. PF1-24]|uniref:alginate O-acetyltransferase AlgX-related protein n=1 Tax=unclassified Enterococcus TaxID=2608891 RepID=UPI00247371E2|nr:MULTISPECIES: hypothetical protein [unclassified Enterococcus]MDH6365291.1 hypothetical protein [Enterococcus sp. PFB1-1]MDH6402379.1 hypothetical protein [Enterococcus sp. PF1-24]